MSENPTPATPGAALEQPAKSQVTPSDSTGTLPPAWAVEAWNEICDTPLPSMSQFVYSSRCREARAVVAATIIARHAPPPVPVSPPFKEREELVERIQIILGVWDTDIDLVEIHQALTDAITFISGAAAVARKE
jgi:hypothetical protein